AREEPEVLNGWADEAVVEVDENRGVGGPEHVAPVQVAVDALRARSRERRGDGVGDVERHVTIARRQRPGDEVALHQGLDRLVDDRRARPAARAIELYDEAPLVLQLHLVDAVLEGAQRQAAAGAAEASHLDRLEHTVRGEGEEGRAGLVWRAAQCPSAFSIFAQVSRSPTVRLRTRPEGVDSSESTQKYPWRSNW